MYHVIYPSQFTISNSWKGKYKIIPTWQHHGNSFCRLCEQLHKMYPEETGKDKHKISKDDEKYQYRKVYENMRKYWVTDAECLHPHNNKQFYEYIRG